MPDLSPSVEVVEPVQVRANPHRRLVERDDVVQVIDETRVRNIHTLIYEQLSDIPFQQVEWDAVADMTGPRIHVSEVFDLQSAQIENDFDGRSQPVAFTPRPVRQFAGNEPSRVAAGRFLLPLWFGDRPTARIQFRYDTLGAFPKLAVCSEHYATIIPNTLRRLAVRIEGRDGMRVLPTREHLDGSDLGPVYVERIDAAGGTIGMGPSEEGISADASRGMAILDGALACEIAEPKAGHVYRFTFRAERIVESLPRSVRLAAAAFLRDLPALLDHRRANPNEKWAAYHGSDRIGIAASRARLRELGAGRGVPADEVRIFGIDAAAATNPIDVTL